MQPTGEVSAVTTIAPAHTRTQAHQHPSTRAQSTAHLRTPAQTPVGTSIYKEQGAEAESDGPRRYSDLVEQEREEREAHGITPGDYGDRWRAAFRYLTGDAPMCGPGECDKAEVYWQRVCEAMQIGGWTPGEWHQLHRAYRVWGRRARGQDAKFNAMGTRPGRPTFEDRQRIRACDGIITLQQISRSRNGAGR